MENINYFVDKIGELFNDDMHGFRSEVYRVISKAIFEAKSESAEELTALSARVKELEEALKEIINRQFITRRLTDNTNAEIIIETYNIAHEALKGGNQ